MILIHTKAWEPLPRIEITRVTLLKEGREEDVDGYNTVPMRNTTCFTAISSMLYLLERTWGKSRPGCGLFSHCTGDLLNLLFFLVEVLGRCCG